jgi:hypothetical protein
MGIILWGYILPSLREVWRLGNDLVAEERVGYIPVENEGIMALR